MFCKNDAELLFAQYGFNQVLKNDETIEKTAKAFVTNEYTVANGPKGRNRLNSGILRNQFLLLLDSLKGRPLNDYAFTGVSLLHDDQYVLVHQDPNSELWEVYQGDSPNNPRRIYQSITLQSFFNEITAPSQDQNNTHQGGTKGRFSAKVHSQIIYYGVPGCGKSFEVNKVINKKLDEYGITDKQYHKIRCVFHPEYCNADFVGQIFPCVLPDNKGVEYKFKPGPLAEIIRRAYLNPDEPFFLIVEEINRGNAAAIFGEMFQLLDRIKRGEPADDSTGNIYSSGWSSYGIDNQDINAYIRDIQKLSGEKTNEKNKHSAAASGSDTDSNPKCYANIAIKSKDESVLHFSVNTAIRLPPNLSIYATMNTSDQNVFTMDNAFQRRFKFKMIENELDNAAQYDIIIGRNDENETSTDVRWGSFRKWINKKILSQNTVLSKSEDKSLGGWFITTDAIQANENGKVTEYENISREDFAEKVLKYLWYDVFKRNTGADVFNKDSLVDANGIVSFANVVKTFKDIAGFEAFKKVFKIDETEEAELKKTYAESKVNH